MQLLPTRQKAWEQPLSNLLGTLGSETSKFGQQYMEQQAAKKKKKEEKEQEEQSRTRQGQAYSAMLGISPEEGVAIANAPAEIQSKFMQLIIDRGGLNKSRRENGMNVQEQAPSMQPEQHQLGSMQQQREMPYGMELLDRSRSLRPEEPGSFLTNRILNQAGTGIKPAVQQAQLSPQKQLQQDIQASVRNYDINKGLDMNPTNISGLLANGMSKQEAAQAIKDTAEYDKKLKQEAHAAKDLIRITKDMTDLVERDIKSGGKLLRKPKEQEWLKSLEEGHGYGGVGGALGSAVGGLLGFIATGGSLAGVGAGVYAGKQAGQSIGEYYTANEIGRIKQETTKETQQFEKNSAEFVKGAKGIFGSRITDADLNAFMKMVPTLSNTNEGKLAILRNIQLVNEAALVKEKVRNHIVKENGNRRPYNLEDMVEEISEPIIDKMANQFKKETEALFEKFNQPESGATNKSLIPGLPGSYNTGEL